MFPRLPPIANEVKSIDGKLGYATGKTIPHEFKIRTHLHGTPRYFLEDFASKCHASAAGGETCVDKFGS